MPTTELTDRTEQVDHAIVPDSDAHLVAAKLLRADPGPRRSLIIYLVLPAIFLTVTLLGGMRLGGADSSFMFLPPPLVCLIFAAILLVLFFRSRVVSLGSWFSEGFTVTKNVADGFVLLTLFAACSQIFNSLIPEQGLPFWVIGFCFFWTLWYNLFAQFDVPKLYRSLGSLFGLAFVIKYLVLVNLAAPDGRSWLERIVENPARESFRWLLDLPQFARGTGYIQFAAAVLFLLGLYLLPASAITEGEAGSASDGHHD